MTSEPNSHKRESKVLSERLDTEFALKAARLGVWELDPATNLINWDSRCRELFGLAGDTQLPYEQALRYIHPDDISRVDKAVAWAMNPESDGVYDSTYRTIGADDGVLRWVRFVGQGYFTGGTLHRFAGIAQDVTKDAQAQLEASEARFRSLVAEAPVATCLFVGKEMRIDVANDTMLRYWGKDRTVVGKPLVDALPELEGQPFGRILDDVFATGTTYEAKAARAELEIDGVACTYYFDYTYKPLRNPAGEVYAIMDTAVDVTDQVAAQQKLEESERYFRQLTDTAPAILWLTEPNGYCTYLNKQWYDYTGQTREQAEGFGWLDVTHPDDKEEAGRRFVEANQKQVPFNMLYRLRGKDGGYRWAVDKGSPQFGANGGYEGMIGTVIDIHDRVVAQRQLEASEALFKNVTSSAPTGLWLSDEAGGLTYLNSTLVDWTGLPYEDLLGSGWVSAIIGEDRQRAAGAFRAAVAARSHYDVLFRLKKADGRVIWCQSAGDPYYHEDGHYAGYAGFCTDLDELVRGRETLRQSEAKLRSVISNAPAAIGLFVGRDLRIELPNKAFIDVVGKGPDIVGRPLREVMPELESQAFLQILDDVYTSGRMFQHFGAQVDIVRQGVMTHNFYNITYSPLFDAEGNVYAILDIAIDVTEEIKARQKLEESELFARTVFEHSPNANIIYLGEDMVVGTVNNNMLEMLGRDASIVGKPFMEVMPELVSTPVLERFRRVLTTGETHFQSEEKLHLVRHGQPYVGYYNYVYKALNNATGELYGVICTATEVTHQVLARQKVEEIEINLRSALELAELATWSLDIANGSITYSERFMNWLGFSEETKALPETYDPLPTDYRQSVAETIAAVIRPGSTGFYENEHPIINLLTGQERIIHAQAQLIYDADGHPVRLSGTARDVTEQRNVRLALERQVQERTEELEATNEELAATNEELAATNEELAVTNEELTESNQLLIRSNESLQQFAYVASHDLQEPLRKIQSFGDLLKNRYATELGEGVDHLERMQIAASRMSTLIRDLLAFSRISTQQDTITPVALSQVVGQVLTDLELRIQETDATVRVAILPTVAGDVVQLGQLFQNLISNALKFRRVTAAGVAVPPQIQVSARTVAFGDLPPAVTPTRLVESYHRIDVADNGIGFDDKYVDRIFQVFQRLHGKGEFAGTGIGLAICEKVAANHGGAITATSQPGEGAIFSVYLPA